MRWACAQTSEEEGGGSVRDRARVKTAGAGVSLGLAVCMSGNDKRGSIDAMMRCCDNAKILYLRNVGYFLPARLFSLAFSLERIVREARNMGVALLTAASPSPPPAPC
jgi:hypothetical protein